MSHINHGTTSDGTMLKYNVDVNVLAAIAEFFLCLGGELSHWYIISDGDFDNESHLSHRLGIDQGDYQKMLVTAGLASFRGGNCMILSDQWVNLRGHHHIAARETISSTPLFEVTSFRVGPSSKHYNIYAIRIGRRVKNSPNALGLQRKRNILPPRSSNTLRVHQEAFR